MVAFALPKMLPMIRIRFITVENRNQTMPFEPGKSGNPGGRPKGNTDLRKACRDLTDDVLTAWKAALLVPGERVMAGDRIMAYAYGKPVARIDHRIIRSTADLSDEELAALIASGDEAADGQELVH